MKKRTISKIIASFCIALLACIPLLMPKTTNPKTASANYIPNSPIGYYSETSDSNNHQRVDIFLSNIVSGSNYSKQIFLYGGDGSDGTHFDINQVFHVYKNKGSGVDVNHNSIDSDGISYHASPCQGSVTPTNMQISSVVKMTNNIIVALYNGYISASASADYSSLDGQYSSSKGYDKVDHVAMYFFAFNKDDVSKSAGQRNTESKQINGFTGTNTVLSYGSEELSNVEANVFEMVFTCFYQETDEKGIFHVHPTSTNYIQIKAPSFTFTTTDTAAPTTTVNQVNAEQFVQTRNLELAVSDADSGVQRLEVSYNGGEYVLLKDYTSDLTFSNSADYEAKKDVTENYTVEQNGTYKFRTTDNVGNVSETEYVESGIDKGTPTLEVTGLESVVFSALRDFSFTATITDTDSVSPNHFRYSLSVNGAEESSGDITESKAYNFSVNGNGVYTLTISGVDEAGNAMEDKVYTLIVNEFDLKELYKTTYLDFSADTETNGLSAYTFRADLEIEGGESKSIIIENGLNKIPLDKIGNFQVTCKFYATLGETSYFGWQETIKVDNEYCDLTTSAVNGTIDPSGSVKRGEYTVNFEANEGYSLYTLKLNGEIQSEVQADATSFTFVVDNPVTIEVVFRKIVALDIVSQYTYNGGMLALQFNLTEELPSELKSQFSNDIITFTYFDKDGVKLEDTYTYKTGKYKVTYSIDTPLFVGSGEQEFKIIPLAIEITNIQKVYNYTGSNIELVFDEVNQEAGVYVTFTKNGEPAEFNLAGEYAFVITTENANYEVYADGIAVILPNIKNVSETETAYNGAEQFVSFEFDGTESGVYAKYFLNGTETTPKKAGDYTVKFYFKPGETEYELDAETVHTLVISKVNLTVTATSLEKVYDGEVPEVSATADGFVGGYTYTFALTHSLTKNVGDYEIIIVRAEEEELLNYNITYIDGLVKITPKTVYVKSSDGLSKQYGDKADPVFTTEYIIGKVDGDNLGLTLYRDPGEAVGTYDIKAEITNQNYTLDFTKTQFTITKRLAIISIKNASKVYGDKAEEIYDFVRNDMVLAEDVATVLASITRDAGEDAGEYKLYLDTSLLDDNYIIISASAKFTITKRPIKVVASGYTDENAVIFGESKPLTYTVYDATSNTIMSDIILAGNLEREPGEETGTYQINIGTLVCGKNYEITGFESAVYEIVPRKITVRANAVLKVYGDAEILTYEVFDYGTENALEGVVLAGGLEREQGEDVGTYQIKLGSLNGGKNYEISAFEGANLEISKADLTIYLADKYKGYGEADEPLIPEITGAKNGDELIVVLVRAEGEDLGSYPITIDLDASSDIYKNYNVNYVEAYYTIQKTTISFSLSDKTTTYSGESQSIDEIASIDKIDPSEISYVYSHYGQVMDELPVDAGEYSVKAIFAGNDYYEAYESEAAKLTIEQKLIPITIKKLEFIYDGTAKTPEIEQGLEEEINILITYNKEPIEVGTYIFTIISNNPNYTCNITMTMKILPAFAKDSSDTSVSAESVSFSNSSLEFVEIKNSGLKSIFSSSTDGRRCVSVYSFKNAEAHVGSNEVLKVSIKARLGEKDVELYIVDKNGKVTPISYELIDGYYVLQVNDVTASVLVTVSDKSATYIKMLVFVLVLLVTYYVSKNIRKRKKDKFLKKNTSVRGITERDYAENEEIVNSVIVDDSEYETKSLVE